MRPAAAAAAVDDGKEEMFPSNDGYSVYGKYGREDQKAGAREESEIGNVFIFFLLNF